MKYIMPIIFFACMHTMSFAQSVSDYAAGKTLCYFSGDGLSLVDYKTGETILHAGGDTIRDYKTGNALYYLSSDRKSLYFQTSGKTVLSMDDKNFREYSTGETRWVLENQKYIKDYATWGTLYYSNAALNPMQVCMVLIAMGHLDHKGNIAKMEAAKKSPVIIEKTVTANATGKLEIDADVAAKWKDGRWYLGKITAINGNEYAVTYADGDKGTVGKDDIKALSSSITLKKGDRVLATWKQKAGFYEGVVDSIEKDGAVIIWDDGSPPSKTPLSRIIKN